MKTKKARMGRPPVKNARRFMVNARVTAAEGRALRAAARAAGLTLSGYILTRCGIGR